MMEDAYVDNVGMCLKCGEYHNHCGMEKRNRTIGVLKTERDDLKAQLAEANARAAVLVEAINSIGLDAWYSSLERVSIKASRYKQSISVVDNLPKATKDYMAVDEALVRKAKDFYDISLYSVSNPDIGPAYAEAYAQTRAELKVAIKKAENTMKEDNKSARS